ncbi:MAG: hypothetical protein EOO63_17555 [Hymenobacter sp.]|nr:MAG: hypothetical protein EOO63_17555 [Hymenobacter sp.]
MQRRHAAHHLIDTYRISARRACRVLRLQRASFAYQAHRRDNTVAPPRLRELAQVRGRYGSQRLYMGQPYPCAATIRSSPTSAT